MVEQAIKKLPEAQQQEMKIANGRCSYGRYGYGICE